ncbi:MAG: fused MFS/spermidine synthase, partial [Candidatus Didemnitutus sp.]|nr:fused MFS/spermidine synthase [Candidatus Didemnitutus sp.]
LTIMLAVVFLRQTTGGRENIVATSRNFYGTLKVRSSGDRGTASHYHLLSHGITTHGLQLSQPPYDTWPTSYYGSGSGIGLALDHFGAVPGGRHLAVVGLGTGTLAAYGERGDRLRVYEINPAVLEIARAHFTYLALTKAGVKLVLGDARLSLEEEWRHGGSQQFDVLALDAFSSDAIPVHLLTREAFELYLHHLKPSGVIAVHISNRHVDLRPVVEALARHFELHFATVTHRPGDEDWWLYRTTWMLLSRDETRVADRAIQAVADDPSDDDAKVILWTDDWASLLGVLR